MINKKLVENLLYHMYIEQRKQDEITYDNVDSFYAYLGYTLEQEQLLKELQIESTSDLVDMLKTVEERDY